MVWLFFFIGHGLFHVAFMFLLLGLDDLEILKLLVEPVLFLDNKVENFLAEKLFSQHKGIIMGKKPNQMKFFLAIIPDQYFITDAFLLLFIQLLPASNKILIHNWSKIDLSSERVVLDFWVKLVEGTTESILEHTLFHDDSLWIKLVIDVQPTRFAVHDVIFVLL